MYEGRAKADHGGIETVRLVRPNCYAFEFLKLLEVILDKMTPFLHLVVDDEWVQPLRPLRDNNLRSARVQIVDDPIAVECLIREHRAELDALDQRRDADGVVAVCRHQNEPLQVAKCIHKGQDFGRPTPL